MRQVGNWLEQANFETCWPKGQLGIQVFVEPCKATIKRNVLIELPSDVVCRHYPTQRLPVTYSTSVNRDKIHLP